MGKSMAWSSIVKSQLDVKYSKEKIKTRDRLDRKIHVKSSQEVQMLKKS